MKLGLVARADNTGLGNQTYEFYQHMKPAKTMVVDISDLNHNKQYFERYPGAQIVHGFPNKGDIEEFLQDLDVVFVAEAPYNYYLYKRARELGVKTAVQYNYEFFDWFSRPHLPKPDMLIAPSKWNYEIIDKFSRENDIIHTYLHCPVNRNKLPFRKIKKARRFLHVVGRSAAHDRNGTETVIKASRYIDTPVKIILHFQGEQGLSHQATHSVNYYRDYIAKYGDPNFVTIRNYEAEDYAEVYAGADVLLLPRRYGGNCLPMNEALACGMPVLMTAIEPNTSFLPPDWLIPAEKIDTFTPRTTIDIYQASPRQLASRIDYYARLSEKAMLAENDRANDLADTISWRSMGNRYRYALEDLCKIQ